MNILQAVLALSALSLLAACTAQKLLPGAWEYRQPGGSSSNIEIKQLRDREYYIYAKGHPIAGVYKQEENLLIMISPESPRLQGYVWNLMRDGSLTLVEEAAVPLSGQRLISSTLVKVQ